MDELDGLILVFPCGYAKIPGDEISYDMEDWEIRVEKEARRVVLVSLGYKEDFRDYPEWAVTNLNPLLGQSHEDAYLGEYFEFNQYWSVYVGI